MSGTCDAYDIAYERMETARLLDTEGYIGCVISRDGPRLEINLGMTNDYYPRKLHRRFGGHLGVAEASTENGKPMHRWHVTGSQCRRVIEHCLHELHVKKRQGELQLLFLTTVHEQGTRPSGQEKELRFKIYQLLRILNAKGRHGYRPVNDQAGS